MWQALIRGRHGQEVRPGGVSWGRCRAPRYRSLSFPPTIQSAPVASGQNCLALSWMLAKLERERAGKRTRQLRRWGSMLAVVGPAIPSHCPTSRYPMSSRRWSESRPSAAAWFTRGRDGRSARTRREARSGWRGRLSRDSSRPARPPLSDPLLSRLVREARTALSTNNHSPTPCRCYSRMAILRGGSRGLLLAGGSGTRVSGAAACLGRAADLVSEVFRRTSPCFRAREEGPASGPSSLHRLQGVAI
jgi:hypothetical protein